MLSYTTLYWFSKLAPPTLEQDYCHIFYMKEGEIFFFANKLQAEDRTGILSVLKYCHGPCNRLIMWRSVLRLATE